MTRRLVLALATPIAAAALVVVAAPSASAMDLATPEVYLVTNTDTQAAGACSFVFSGPSTNPSATPYHIAGYAEVRSGKVVVSTSIRCRVRRSDDGTQVGQTLAQAAPGSSSTVVGDIWVNQDGPYEICTWIDATFGDTTTLNPSNEEHCRRLTNPLYYLAAAQGPSLGELIERVRDKLIEPPPPPPNM